MRQIGTEFNQDPYASPQTEGVDYIEIPAEKQAEHLNWMNSKASAAQHMFCGKLCVNFNDGAFSTAESDCMNNCFDKYHKAFSFF